MITFLVLIAVVVLACIWLKVTKESAKNVLSLARAWLIKSVLGRLMVAGVAVFSIWVLCATCGMPETHYSTGCPVDVSKAQPPSYDEFESAYPEMKRLYKAEHPSKADAEWDALYQSAPRNASTTETLKQGESPSPVCHFRLAQSDVWILTSIWGILWSFQPVLAKWGRFLPIKVILWTVCAPVKLLAGLWKLLTSTDHGSERG